MKIRNWERLQTYKDREPKWIKIYRRLLDDREIAELTDKAYRLLTLLWLVAADQPTKDGKLAKDGTLPSPADIAFRIRWPLSTVEKHLTELNHWIVQDCTESYIGVQNCISETETEAETETEKRQSAPVRVSEFDLFWNTYPKKTAKGGARKAYARAAKTKDWPGLDAVIEAIEHAKESKQWRADNGQYIPGPAKWLNNGQWDDEASTQGDGYLELISEFEQEASDEQG